MATLNQFISQVKATGLARDNKYLVSITPPRALIGGGPRDAMIRLLCQSVSMPGLNYVSNPVLTYGEQREVIYNRQYDPVSLEFVLDGKMDIKRYFDSWQQLMIDPVSRMVNYYENYIGTIDIAQLDGTDAENEIYSVKLHECYPKIVSPIQYSAGAKDFTKLQVQIEYKYWTPAKIQTGTNVSPTTASLPSLDNVGGFPAIASAFSPPSIPSNLGFDFFS
jgi:hypothetical protein